MNAVTPHQILCLEYEATSLYGEVIQVIAKRNLYWLRPLALVYYEQEQRQISALYDLRQGSDLLCPQILFRVALDIEVLPVLTELGTLKSEGLSVAAAAISHQQFQSFLNQVWQANPEAFQPCTLNALS